MSSNSPGRVLGAVAIVAFCTPALAVEDLRSLEVVGQRAQSPEQARRDRYECHNWSVSQTGETPLAAPADEREPRDADGDRRRERVSRTIAGAIIGAGIGGLFGDGHRHRRHSAEPVLAGAAVGAAIGAATAGGRDREVDADVAEQSDYLRALTACLEGRGYSVHLPAGEGRDARGRATQARAGTPEVEQRREQLPGAVADAELTASR
jgi:hypothetical protein